MIKVVLDKGAYLPEKAHKDTDAGFDLRTPIDFIVPKNGGAIIDTGVHVEIPKGFVGMIKSKSGLNVKHDLVAEGVVDSGYVGSIVVKLYNHGAHTYGFVRGEKITQLVIMPIHPCNEMTVVDHLEETERGDGGFGSTGK